MTQQECLQGSRRGAIMAEQVLLASFARLLMLLYVISKVGSLLSTSPLQTPVDDDYDEIDNIFVRSSLIMFIINTVFCLLLKRSKSLSSYKAPPDFFILL